jgi:hypothetical protein
MQNNPVYRNHDGSVITIKPTFLDDDLGEIIKDNLPSYFDNEQGGEDVEFDPITGEERSSRDD